MKTILCPLRELYFLFIKQVYARKFMVWCLTLEEITFDLENRSMEMQTKLLKACKYYPNLSGDESIIYKAIDDQKTHYSVLIM